MEPDLRAFLASLTNRSHLNDIEQEAILRLPAHVSKIDANRDFVRLDQVVDHASVVVEGIVARFGQNSEGERQIYALHIAGDAPDLHTVVLPSDTVPLQALSETTILRIPNSALRAVAARYPAVAEAFWRHCCVDAAITAEWVVNIGRRDAKTRISHLFCEMAVRCGAPTDEGEVTYPFPLTQAHIGDATALTSIHVNRTLKALSEEGWVTLAGRAVRIPNWEKLVKRAEFDAQYLQAGFKPNQRLRIVG